MNKKPQIKKWKRICPKCKKEVFHTSKYYRNVAEKKEQWCAPCRRKEVWARKDYREKRKTGYSTGENNPFYGKKHSAETKMKMSKADKSYTKTKKFRKKMSKVTTGKKNPRYGISNYETWCSKYGKEEADKRMKSFKTKLSKIMSGSGNPMYGKPSPQGAGNGWSGWYNGCFFRSLRELSYIVCVLEKEKHKWSTCEKLGIKIPYVRYDRTQRTYTPDFLVDDNILVEIKPSKLKSSKLVREKQKAAKKYCKNKKWKYKLIDPPLISSVQLSALYNSGAVKFTKAYTKKYKEWVKTHPISK